MPFDWESTPGRCTPCATLASCSRFVEATSDWPTSPSWAIRTWWRLLWLCARGAMADMRYLSLDLALDIYIDPVLLDVGVVVDALPVFGVTIIPS
jgi:hypothetical protein